jgi:hypothetical protein
MGQFTTGAATETSTETLASLMFQLQMTGYMFKNADYRLSLKQSLSGATERLSNGQVAAAAKTLAPAPGSTTRSRGTSTSASSSAGPAAFKDTPLSERPVSGTVSVTTADGKTLAVDADAYVAELKVIYHI